MFLDRRWPHRIAVAAATACTGWALTVAVRSIGAERRRYLALGALTALEALGLVVARRRRAGLE
jgi:hypothetical protein